MAAIGIVGLGLVGRALAARLTASDDVAGIDLRPEAVARAAAEGIACATSLAELAARSDVLVVCVLDDSALDSVVGELSSLASFDAGSGPLVVNCVTCSPAAADRTASALDAIDMPLSGSSLQIRAGEALGLVGASRQAWDQHAALLRRLCPRLVHVGAPGAGARAKLASNLVLGLNRSALAEGIALAAGLGLDAHAFVELLRRSPAYSRALDTAAPRMLANDFAASASRIAQHRKDVALVLDEAELLGLDLPLARGQLCLLDRAMARGMGELDNVAVIAALQGERP